MLAIRYLLALAFIFALSADGLPTKTWIPYIDHNQGSTDFSRAIRNLIANELLEARLRLQTQEYQLSNLQGTHYMDLRKMT